MKSETFLTDLCSYLNKPTKIKGIFRKASHLQKINISILLSKTVKSNSMISTLLGETKGEHSSVISLP